MKTEKSGSILKKSHDHDKIYLLSKEEEKEQIGGWLGGKELGGLPVMKNNEKDEEYHDGGISGRGGGGEGGYRGEKALSGRGGGGGGGGVGGGGGGGEGEGEGGEEREGGEEGAGREGEGKGETLEEGRAVGGGGLAGSIKHKKILAFNVSVTKSLKSIKSEGEDENDSKSNTIRTNKSCKPAKIRRRGATAFSSFYN